MTCTVQYSVGNNCMKRSKFTNFSLFLSLAPSELAIVSDAELLLQSQINPLVSIFLLSVLDYSVHAPMQSSSKPTILCI